jgi:hypothetical protein
VTDSLGNEERVASALVISALSSDTTVLHLDSAQLHVQAGSYGAFPTITPRGTGSAWVHFSAPAYVPDSLLLAVVPARLHFVGPDVTAIRRQTIAVGEFDALAYVWTGDTFLSNPVVVTLTQRHPERLRVPGSLSMPANGAFPYVPVPWTGLAAGPDTVIASAPGYLPDTVLVQVTTPSFVVQNMPTSGLMTNAAYITVFVSDSFGITHYPAGGGVKVRITSSDTTVLRPGTDTVTIGNTTGGSGFNPVLMVAPGIATLTLTAVTGAFLPTVVGPVNVAPTRLTIVDAGTGAHSLILGMRQHFRFGGIAVGIVNYGGAPASIHLHSSNTRLVVPAVNDVFGGGAQFDVVTGDSTGTAWVVATGRGLMPDSVAVTVGQPSFALLTNGGGFEGSQDSVEIQIRDQGGNLRITAEPVPVALSSTDDAVVGFDSTQITISTNSYNAFTRVHFLSPGVAALRVSDPRAVPQQYGGASGLITVRPSP